MPFDSLTAGTRCVTVSTPPFPHTRCTTVNNVSTKEREVIVVVTPSGQLAAAPGHLHRGADEVQQRPADSTTDDTFLFHAAD